MSNTTVGAIIFFGGIILVAEFILRLYAQRLRRWHANREKHLSEDERIETLSLSYFRKAQRITIVRFWLYIGVLVLASLVYDIHTFSYLAVVAGALLLIFKETVISLAASFFIGSRYEIGDDIKIKDILGEIIRIRPLSVSILGKDESGDHTGKLISIPNYLFMMEIVQRQELKHDIHRMITLTALYTYESFGISFTDFYTNLKTYLDEYLPKRNSAQVGHYKSFASLRYKLNYDYDERGNVSVRIRFVSSPRLASERKEHIITHIEMLRARSSSPAEHAAPAQDITTVSS